MKTGLISGAVVLLLAMIASPKGISASGAPADEMIELEPLLVQATRPTLQPNQIKLFGRNETWLHVLTDDYEILSQCDTEQTLAVAKHLSESLALSKKLVPSAHLSPPPVPQTFIMFDQEPSPALDKLLPDSITEAGSINFGNRHNRVGLTAGGNDVCDDDTHCVVQNRRGMAWAWAGGGLGRGPIPTGLWFDVSHCTPALPLWYQLGLIGPCGLLRQASDANGVWLANANWISDSETERILSAFKKSGTLPMLPPVEDLFRQSTGEKFSTQWPSPAWMAEAALLLRWGLYANESRRPTFEQFVERARNEPVTETMFRECFGFGYAELQLQLTRYLIDAARHPVGIRYDSPAFQAAIANFKAGTDPSVTCRTSTHAEIARLLGDWERMEGNARKNSSPRISRLFLKQAGKTLQQAYDEGERDPGFLAVLGLQQFDTGAKIQARQTLNMAVASEAVRPAAYVTLAQLNFENAQIAPETVDGKLNAEQVATILTPLFAVRKNWRLSATGYVLIADTWSHSLERPSRAHLAALQEGIKFYPLHADLILASVKAYAHWGYFPEARELINRTSKQVDEFTARQLSALQLSLENVSR